jgi:hypothetical protein
MRDPGLQVAAHELDAGTARKPVVGPDGVPLERTPLASAA